MPASLQTGSQEDEIEVVADTEEVVSGDDKVEVVGDRAETVVRADGGQCQLDHVLATNPLSYHEAPAQPGDDSVSLATVRWHRLNYIGRVLLFERHA